MDQSNLDIVGTAAVSRQLSTAMSFLHNNRVTHNDVKPENVFLKVLGRQRSQLHLQAKLADFGSAEYSVERDRDVDLVAYTMWCMALGEKFKNCPRGDSEQLEATQQLSEKV